MQGLKDKVAIVAGAATGLGAASARRLAQEDARDRLIDRLLACGGCSRCARAGSMALGTSLAMESYRIHRAGTTTEVPSVSREVMAGGAVDIVRDVALVAVAG